MIIETELNAPVICIQHIHLHFKKYKSVKIYHVNKISIEFKYSLIIFASKLLLTLDVIDFYTDFRN